MTKLKYLILTIILLSLALASAEEITLDKEQTTEYKGIELTLLKVGTYGSAQIRIGSVEKTISKGGAKEIYGLRLKNVLSGEEFVKLDITMIAECLENSDCNDGNKKTKDICLLRECEHEELTCCLIGNQCRNLGSTETIDEKSMYCTKDYEWIERKPYKTACSNNYECLTNYCDNYCKLPSMFGINKGKMAPAWILIIIGILMILESLLFIINPNLGKRITENIILKTENKNLKILFIITAIIGIALIYWALI